MNINQNLKSISGILMITAILIGICVIEVSAAPGNDNFADSTAIPGVPYADSVDTTDATTEEGETLGWSNFQRTVWYAFTPDMNGVFSIKASGDYFSVLAVYIGSDFNNLLSIDSRYGEGGTEIFLNGEVGVTYYVQAYLMDWNSADFGGILAINIDQIYPPVNDNFANAKIITEIPFTDTLEKTEGTTEPGENSCAWWWNSQQTIWYAFTPTTSDEFTIESIGGAYAILAVYTGSDLYNLQSITCTWGNNRTEVILQAEAGITYYFQTYLADWGGTSWDGPLTFNITQNIPPANDNFSGSSEVSETPYSDTVDTTFASTEEGEPNNCAWTFHKTIWYSFTPAESGYYTISSSGEQNYTTLVVYTGTNLGDLQYIDCRLEAIPKITMILEQGTTYYFQIFNNSDIGGSVTYNIKLVIPPTNDNFSNAKSITEMPFVDSVDTILATTEQNEPTDCSWNLQKTIWHVFTPTMNGSFTAESSGGGYATLAVYQGTDFSGLVMLACSTDWTARTTISMEAGSTYYFQTHINDESYGTQVNFNLFPTPPPEAYFSYWPGDPNKFEGVQFYNNSYDPYGSGIESCSWDFGDGSTAADCYPVHAFTADGDYTVQLEVTTYDGRTAATSQTVQVRTHDVGITKLTAPASARAGQTKQISVSVKNLYYPETVQVDLYKVTQNGLEFIGSITQDVPIRPPNRAQVFTYNYTFTSGDAAIGKVNFKAFVTIIEARDAFPVDNELISYATKVTR